MAQETKGHTAVVPEAMAMTMRLFSRKTTGQLSKDNVVDMENLPFLLRFRVRTGGAGYSSINSMTTPFSKSVVKNHLDDNTKVQVRSVAT